MSEVSLNELSSLLFQLALNNRERSQKKNEIKQQIREHNAEIAETKSHTETLQGNIKKLEEEINVKQSRILKNKENTNSMKATSSLLLQYEQTTKADLESRKTSYNHDLEVYEEKISCSRRTLESYKEGYFKNPFAQKLLKLQGENDGIKSRIKACNDQIMTKQKETEHFTDPAAKSTSTEKLSDSDLGQQPTSYEEQSEHQTEENEDSAINDSSPKHLDQTAKEGETYVEANVEEDRELNKVQDFPTCLTSPEKANKELWSYPLMEEQSQPDEIDSEAQNQETSEENQVLEEQMAVLDVGDVLEDEMETRAPSEEEQAPTEEDHQVSVFPQSSHQQANPESLSGKTASLASTFPFNLSPTGSPLRDTSEAKSPAFLFASTSNASTPGFSGFGFDVNSSQEEDSSFAFTGSLFSEKKATEAKLSSYPEFLFDQPDKSEDFQFAFAAKSPQSASKENEFPFSFNF